jgi:hypothetical protein
MIDTSTITEQDNGRAVVYHEVVNGRPHSQRGVLLGKSGSQLFLEVTKGFKGGKPKKVRVSVESRDAHFA